MNVERNNNQSVIVLHESEESGFKKSQLNGEITSESDTSADPQFYKIVCKDRCKKHIVSADLNSRFSLKNSVKHDANTGFSKTAGIGEDKDEQLAETDEDALSRSKKKKKKRCLTICTSNCKYDAVRRVAARYGMKEVTEDSSWNLYWTDLSVSIERAKDMRRYQKVNHFPGMTEICRKDLLARNLNRMLKLFPREYNFFPKTWCFPADHGDAMAYARQKRLKTFIVKPDSGCQGRGIYLTRNLRDVKLTERMICQLYIAKPFLIDGYKFDFRIYTLITSCDPLRIYVYNDGLVRFATSRYKEPTGHNTSNVFMHLTNYAVNKHSRMYIADDEIGSKRKISTLNKWMKLKEIDVDELWGKIDEIIVKTILAAYPVLKHSYHTCFPTHDRTYACFELLGFDVLLDWKLKPYLLEVNHSPSFHTEAQIDKDIKENLLTDTFEMLNLQQCDKRKIIEEDKKRIRDRLLQGLNAKESSPSESTNGFAKLERTEEDSLQKQFEWEEEHMGNFRRVYPCSDDGKYEPFFKQNNTSVFQETVASRAREEAARMQKEENELRAREEESKRICGRWSEAKINPESPYASNRQHSAVNVERPKLQSSSKKQPAQSRVKEARSLHSFEPEVISESEERERVTALAQRDFLIKSYGMLEQIYLAMRKNGTLRDVDEKKYGLYGRLGTASDSGREPSSPQWKCHRHRHQPHRRDPRCEGSFVPTGNQASRHSLKGKMQEDESVCEPYKSLMIMCNEAPVYIRPKIPRKFAEANSCEQNSRVTKTHVARTLSNTARLYTLEKRESLSKYK